MIYMMIQLRRLEVSLNKQWLSGWWRVVALSSLCWKPGRAFVKSGDDQVLL